MKNENKIVELLAEQLQRQDEMLKVLRGLGVGFAELKQEMAGLKLEMIHVNHTLDKQESILSNQQHTLIEIHQLLREDVVKIEEAIEFETLPDGKRMIFHKSRTYGKPAA